VESVTAKTAQELRDEVISSARQLGNPWTVRELADKMPSDWPSTSVDRELRRLADEGLVTLVRQYPVRHFVVGRPDVAELADPAPDWGHHYPSGGNLIGPTWQAMWEAMADREWHDVRDLLGVGEAARGCATATVRNQLFAAAKAHHIEPEARFDDESARWRMWYRRTDAAVSA
jgi:hypothetical protein